MSAILLDLEPGDEVIVPSFTFVSGALAFCMHGAKVVFADIRSDTLNIDESKLEGLITERTRAILPVHYAGVGCEMDSIMKIAHKHDLTVIEDNAHGLYGKYRGRNLGTIGHMATQSFHETKNITCGEGGALILNDPGYIERAEIIRDKGTNRASFFRGEVDKYTWIDKGSSYVMSDILAAILFGQLEKSKKIQQRRKEIWDFYNEHLASWAKKNGVRIPIVPDYCEQAYHMFYLLMPDLSTRIELIRYLKQNDISAVFHYVPLHNSKMGSALWCAKNNPCDITSDVSDRLVRLPFYFDLTDEQLTSVVNAIQNFKFL